MTGTLCAEACRNLTPCLPTVEQRLPRTELPRARSVDMISPAPRLQRPREVHLATMTDNRVYLFIFRLSHFNC